MGPAALLLVMAIMFVETALLVGFFLPGDSLLFTVGILVAAHALPLPLWVVGAGAALAAILGDQVGFWLGRRFGPAVFSRAGSRLLNPRHAERAQEFFARHGHKAVVLARFVPVVRSLTPVVAGVARMPHRRFTTYNVLGGVGWTALMLVAGFYAGGVPFVAAHVELVAVGLVALSLVPAVITWLRRRSRRTTAVPVPEPRPLVGVGHAGA
jgi:membrane protein DedA with SNARE-associated domain